MSIKTKPQTKKTVPTYKRPPTWRKHLSGSRVTKPFFFIVAFALIGGGIVLWTHAATETVSGPVLSGITGKCLDDWKNSNVNLTKVDLYSCNGGSAQDWTIETNGTLQIHGKCLDIYQKGKNNGTKVELYSCDGGANQQWKSTDNTLVNPISGKCLDDPGSTTLNGTQLQIYSCNKTAAQVWVVPTVKSTPSTTATSTTGALFAPPNGKVYIGINSGASDIASFDKAAGITTHPAIVGGYTAADGSLQGVFSLYETAAPGATPMVSWNIPMTQNQITNGSKDSYIKAQAAAVKVYGKPTFIRPDWEMNGTWYPGYDKAGGVTPAEYIASWQHIYDIFKSAGVTNAAFVWCPNDGEPAGQPVSAWYPGNNYVNWIGVDGYPQFSGSTSTYLDGTDGMNYMASYAAQNDKPLMLAEWAPNTQSAFSNTAAPIDTVFNWAAAYPNTVKALIYFNYNTGAHDSVADFLLADHPVSAAEFRNFTNGNARFLYTTVQ